VQAPVALGSRDVRSKPGGVGAVGCRVAPGLPHTTRGTDDLGARSGWRPRRARARCVRAWLARAGPSPRSVSGRACAGALRASGNRDCSRSNATADRGVRGDGVRNGRAPLSSTEAAAVVQGEVRGEGSGYRGLDLGPATFWTISLRRGDPFRISSTGADDCNRRAPSEGDVVERARQPHVHDVGLALSSSSSSPWSGRWPGAAMTCRAFAWADQSAVPLPRSAVLSPATTGQVGGRGRAHSRPRHVRGLTPRHHRRAGPLPAARPARPEAPSGDGALWIGSATASGR